MHRGSERPLRTFINHAHANDETSLDTRAYDLDRGHQHSALAGGGNLLLVQNSTNGVPRERASQHQHHRQHQRQLYADVRAERTRERRLISVSKRRQLVGPSAVLSGAIFQFVPTSLSWGLLAGAAFELCVSAMIVVKSLVPACCPSRANAKVQSAYKDIQFTYLACDT